MPNKGDAAGYVDCIWRKCHAKWGMQSFTTTFCVGMMPEGFIDISFTVVLAPRCNSSFDKAFE